MRFLPLAVSLTLLALPASLARVARAGPEAPARAEARYLGRSVSAWRAALKSQEAKQRFEALVALAAIGPDAQAATPDVARLLRDPHALVRQRALGTLARLGPSGVAPLLSALESKDATERAVCCDVLTWSRTPRDVTRSALRPLLHDKVPNVRFLAAFAMTAVDPRDPAPLAVLQEALTGTNPAARTGAAGAAARLGHLARPLLESLLGLFRSTDEKLLVAAGGALRGQDASILPKLIERTATLDAHPSGQIVLLGVIADLGTGDAATARALRPFLEHLGPEVATAALRAVEKIGVADPQLVTALTAIGRGERGRDDVRRPTAWEVLGALGVPLSPRLADTIAAAVTRTIDPESPEAIGPILARFDAAAATRFAPQLAATPAGRARMRLLRLAIAAARAAPSAGPPNAWRQVAEPALERELASADPQRVARAALWAPDLLGAVGTATRLADGTVGTDAEVAEVFATALAPHLIDGLEERDPWYTADVAPGDGAQAEAARTATLTAGRRARSALARLAVGEAIEPSLHARIALAYLQPEAPGSAAGAVEALASKAAPTRRAAAACLARIAPGTKAVIAALTAVVENHNESPVIRRTAAVALARQGTGADRVITRHVKTARGADRRFWLAAWGRAGSRLRALLPWVLEDFEADDARVREAAREGLTAMGPAGETLGPRLASLLTRRSARRRDAGFRALIALGPGGGRFVPALLDAALAAPRAERTQLARWLAQAGPVYAPALARALAEPSWERRLLTLNVLARIGVPAADAGPLSGLAPALDSADSSVRAAALGVLELYADQGADPQRLARVRAALADPIGLVRAAAARTLGTMAILRDPRPDAIAARTALSELATRDPFAFVRAAARAALSAADGK